MGGRSSIKAWALKTRDISCDFAEPSATKGFAMTGNESNFNKLLGSFNNWALLSSMAVCRGMPKEIGKGEGGSWSMKSSMEMRLWRRWIASGESMMTTLGFLDLKSRSWRFQSWE
uniref:Uncharacterized protein n=1 Tax=Opuntia streptacantha TaxID=393608 RepID=A0A7C9D488_OPUST